MTALPFIVVLDAFPDAFARLGLKPPREFARARMAKASSGEFRAIGASTTMAVHAAMAALHGRNVHLHGRTRGHGDDLLNGVLSKVLRLNASITSSPVHSNFVTLSNGGAITNATGHPRNGFDPLFDDFDWHAGMVRAVLGPPFSAAMQFVPRHQGRMADVLDHTGRFLFRTTASGAKWLTSIGLVQAVDLDPSFDVHFGTDGLRSF